MKYLLLLLMALVVTPNLSQAKDPEIVEVSPNTYMIVDDKMNTVWASTSKLKTAVLKQANEFAASKDKIIIPISERASPPGAGRLTYEYQFKLVDPNSPEATGTPMESSADRIVEHRKEYSGGMTIQQETDGETDLYTELLNLDDLRKKGILTDEEFEAQKKKLLEAS